MFMPGLGSEALGARVHRDFAGAVHSLGDEFTILTTEPRPTTAGRAAIGQVLPLSPVWRRMDALAAPWLRTRLVLSSAVALAHHLREAGDTLDLLHVEVAYPFGAAATLGAAEAGWKGPIAITPMGEDTLVLESCHYGFRRHVVARWAVDGTLRRAACIRCISPLHERVVAAIAPDTPRRVIPLNVSSDVVSASEESVETRAARRAAARRAIADEPDIGDRPVVLSLGRLHPFKGIDVLIGAMRHIPEAVLLVAGPSLRSRAAGDEGARLARCVDEWRLADRVRFLGAVGPDRAMQLLAAADVVAVPSRLESLNKVCVEAAAVGTPFVVTDTTGISAWARDAGVGLVVPGGDEHALAHGILTALQDMRSLDPRRVQAFVAQFSPSAVAAAVLTFYRDVTGLA
jgi:glycosyltransferase involved in cell wall biosynthesis